MDDRIAPARPGDVAALPAIERAAAELLRGLAPDAVLDEATSAADFEAARRAGHLWVALVDDRPVGFALVQLLHAGHAHLDEIDVDPRFGRRGIGAALVEAVCDWAVDSGCTAITLTTFRDVAWNMPFYARLGFVELPQEEIGPQLAEVVRDETARGLDPARRVVMRRRLG
jgi:GNAT superfamily N-acetyltransferase